MFKVCLRFRTKGRYRYLFRKYINLSHCVTLYPVFLENWNEKSIRKGMWHGRAGFASRSYWILSYGSDYVIFSTKYVHALVIQSNQDFSLVSKLLTLETEIKSLHAQKKWRGKGFVFQNKIFWRHKSLRTWCLTQLAEPNPWADEYSPLPSE